MFHLVLPVPLLPLTYQRPALPLFLNLPRESQENMTARAPRIPVLPTEGGLRPLAAYAASPRERPFAERREPKPHPVVPEPTPPLTHQRPASPPPRKLPIESHSRHPTVVSATL